MVNEHFCSERLLPGECIVCVGKPRPYVVVNSYAGARRVEVEVLGRTPKRLRIRLLADCLKGERGAVRLVDPSIVRRPGAAP